jgi:thiamine-phosphate pyrophosphorylase
MTAPIRSLPKLHVVTDDVTLARPGWARHAAEVLEAGGPEVALHVRGPRTTGRSIFEHVEGLVPLARSSSATLIVNDRVDLALATGSDGVHLGERSIPVVEARELLGDDRLVGRSAHTAAEVTRARDDGADYAFVGTIYPTPSHPGLPGIGAIGLREAAERGSPLPVLGIGGIDERRVGEVMAGGAYGVAVIRCVWDRSEPGSAVEALIRALQGGNR